MSVLFGLAIAGVFAGIWLVVDAFRNEATVRSPRRAMTSPLPLDWQIRAVQALIAAALVGVATRWPVAALAAGAFGWWLGDLIGNKGSREAEIARTEAIATWTEMLRDTLSGAHGIEETLIASAGVAPAPIRTEVVTLAVALEREPIGTALTRFAHDLAHPVGDLVVTALQLATSGSTRDLGELLSTLAEAAREECAMRLRVEAARARIRTAVRVITACTLLTALGLAVFNHNYLVVYGDLMGQCVLALIAAIWGTSLWWLSRMGRFLAPERFLIPSSEMAR